MLLLVSCVRPPPQHFSTLPPGATLPTEEQCTAWVNANPTVETVPENAEANTVIPKADWLAAMRVKPHDDIDNDAVKSVFTKVTGNFTGSTDMIIRWAACKWGIDEDVFRAQAIEESGWHQRTVGDEDRRCNSISVSPGTINYWSESSPCMPSKGLFQIKLIYHNAGPYAITSTALNADYAGAYERSCINGLQTGLSQWGIKGDVFGPYPPRDPDNALWGCLGVWFSGLWGDSDAENYVNSVKKHLNNKDWLKPKCMTSRC